MALSIQGNDTMCNFQRDSVIINRLTQILCFPLECEKKSLEKGEHPKYLEGITLARQWFDRRLEQIRIEEMKEKMTIRKEYKEGIGQIEQEYAKKLKELEESFLKEQDEQKRSLESEINALDIAIPPFDNGEEFLTNCATQHQAGQSQLHLTTLSTPATTIVGSKKFLRSRQNDIVPSSSVGVDSTLHLGAIGLTDGIGTSNGIKRRTQAKKSGSPFGFLGFGKVEGSVGGFACAIGGGTTFGGTATSSLMIPYLLSESAISEDVYSLGNESVNHCHLAERTSQGSGLCQDGGLGNGVASSGIVWQSAGGEMMDEDGGEKILDTGGKHHKRVMLEQNKLILDGKTFHRLQTVFIELTSSGRMPATIRSIREGRYVEFRSGIPGDTRTFTATKDDLESGRVFVRKRY